MQLIPNKWRNKISLIKLTVLQGCRLPSIKILLTLDYNLTFLNSYQISQKSVYFEHEKHSDSTRRRKMIFLKVFVILCIINFGSAEFSYYLNKFECKFKRCISVCGESDEERVLVKQTENDTKSEYYYVKSPICYEYRKLDDTDKWEIDNVS